MAVRAPVGDRLQSIVDEVAAALGRQGVKAGSASAAKGIVRIEREPFVKRVIRAYWTGFEVNIPVECVGVHLEVAEPRVHWTECYLSNEYRNWVLCFHEREDGDVQLSHYRDYATPSEAIRGFIDLSSWYTLTATDLTWADVSYQVGEGITWNEHTEALVTGTGSAIQESLKKSTILWLKWDDRGVERTMPVWFLYDQKVGSIYVLSGERQQSIPGAASLREVTVVLRWKGKNSQVAELPADVRVLEKFTPEWDEIAERIAEKRLNIPGLPEETAKRWRDECEILELKLRT